MPLDFPNPSDSTTYTDPTSGNTYTFANGSWSIANVLSAIKGGTGFASYNRGDILFGNASGTLSKLSAGTSGYVLSTNGSGADPTWIAMTSSGGAGTVASPNAQYQLAGYYSGTGASVSSSSTFTNNTATGVVTITHATGSTSPSNGALLVSGGVGIAGTLSYYRSQIGVGGTTSLPSMAFIGNTNNPVYLNVLENNSLSFEGYHGQLLSISPDLTSGYVFSVGDISGIPLLRANANANVTANEFGGNFGIGTTNPGYKLEVNGQTAITGSTSSTSTSTGALIVTGGVGIGGSLNVNSLSKFSNHLEIKSGNELRLWRTADTFYTVLKSADVTANRTFTLPLTVGSNGQFLTTDGTGVLSFTTDPIQVNSGSANQIAFYSSAGSSVSGSSTFTNDTSGGVVSITHNTASISTTTGALVVTGGVGIGGSVKLGDGTASGASNQGALIISGGLGVSGSIYAGGVGAFGGNVSSNGSASSFTNGGGSLTITNRVIKSGAIGLALAGNAGTEGTLLSIRRANVRDSSSSGSYAFVAAVAFKKTSFSTLTAGQTYTNAASVYIEDAPDSSTTGAITTPANTVTITNPYALYVENGRSYFGGSIVAGGSGTGYTKTLGNGDIALDNSTLDTPGVLMYWANNKNFGLDTFGSTGATRVRLTRDLNESTGSELFSVDINGVTYVNSGYGQPAPTFGVRAWVNFDGSGTVGTNQTIRGSGNIASVYKNGTGDYTITFTSAMPDANYCIQGLARTPGAADADVALNIKYNTTPAAGSFQITTARYGSALLDCAHIHVSVIR